MSQACDHRSYTQVGSQPTASNFSFSCGDTFKELSISESADNGLSGASTEDIHTVVFS